MFSAGAVRRIEVLGRRSAPDCPQILGIRNIRAAGAAENLIRGEAAAENSYRGFPASVTVGSRGTSTAVPFRRPKIRASRHVGIQTSILLPLIFNPVSSMRKRPM